MTSRAASTRDGSRMPTTGRLLLGGALVLGLGATLVLLLSDDSRLLKLGIVAALWSALVGAFLAARFRRQVTDRADDAAGMQALYELELEREIAARREYELQLEAEAKRKADDESRQDIAALRTELGALRETLQALLGGEVLVERFALQAEATRMRSFPEDSRSLARQNQVKRIDAGPAVSREQVIIPAEPQTELMERVVERQLRQNTTRPPTQRPQRPAPREPQRPPREPERQVQVRQQRPLSREQRLDPADPGSGRSEPVAPPGREPQRPTRESTVYRRPVAGDSDLDTQWPTSWERSGSAAPPPQTPARRQSGRPPRPPKAPEPMQSRPLPLLEPETRAQPAVTPPELPTRVRRPAAADPPRAKAPHLETPRLPAPAAEQGRDQRPAAERSPAEPAGDRRRVPETGELLANPGRHSEPGSQAGGRRRRPEDASSRQQSLKQNGSSHAQPASEPSGSHAEGRSVSELIAAYGSVDNPRRRRRRDD